mmetsp:Transcript_30144/g.65918  ORF Transcript_30144/g.65918 Transcript_30144/m.65918 type:complete len:125 (+) Transcript_30144:278-652(+)
MSIINVLSSVFVINVKGVLDLEEFYILDTIAYFSIKLFGTQAQKQNKNNDTTAPTSTSTVEDSGLEAELEEKKLESDNIDHEVNDMEGDFDYKKLLTPNLVILMRDFDLLLQDPNTGLPITEAQ